MPRTYNAPLDTAVGADNLIPHDVPLSAVEILTYFPHHLKWPDVMFRLFRGGFRGPQMAKIILHARDSLTRDEFRRRKDALRHAILVAGKAFFSDVRFTQTSYANNPRLQPIVAANYPGGDCIDHYNGTEINVQVDSLHDNAPTLHQVANGVANEPTGNDAGKLTKAIQWARAHGQLGNYTTDDVEMIAEWFNFTDPAAAHGPNWDQMCLATVQAIPNP